MQHKINVIHSVQPPKAVSHPTANAREKGTHLHENPRTENNLTLLTARWKYFKKKKLPI